MPMAGVSCFGRKRRHRRGGVAFRLHGPFAFSRGLALAFRLALRCSFLVRFAFAFGLALVSDFAFAFAFAFRLILRRRYQTCRRFLQVRPLTLIRFLNLCALGFTLPSFCSRVGKVGQYDLSLGTLLHNPGVFMRCVSFCETSNILGQ